MSKNKTVRNVFFAIFCLFACVSLGYAESCSSKGQVQYKYTASGCTYTTQSRTCCATTGAWSGWGEECPKTCDPSTKPAETEPCGEDGSGTRSRSVTCDTLTLTWKTGSWGICSYCTPGEVDKSFDRCENFWHQAVCNYSGTAWSCECRNTAERSECMQSPNSFWSPQKCTCTCCPVGARLVPDLTTGSVKCIKNGMQMAGVLCSR